MKTYRLWYNPPFEKQWYQSDQEPYTFDKLEAASTELAKRVFEYGYRYKIMESEEQQS